MTTDTAPPPPPVDVLRDDLLDAARRGDADAIDDVLSSLSVSDQAFALAHLDADDVPVVVAAMDADDAADVIENLPEPQAAGIVAALAPSDAAAILMEMPSDDRADVVGDLSDADAAAILRELPRSDAAEIRELAAYADDVAGGLMNRELIRVRHDIPIHRAVDVIRGSIERLHDTDVRYAYVVDDDGRLVGVLPMHNLLLVRRDAIVRDVMIADPLSVRDDAPLAELVDLFDSHAFLGVPVVDAAGRLVGVVHRESVDHESERAAENDYLKSQGIVGEELRTMPLMLRARRRLSWLSVNVLLNFGAAAVIALFQDTLQSVIALAVFLPIISDMSGCSGNQAVAVSMRELSLGLIRPTDALRVWLQEVSVGAINGAVLGGLVAIAAVVFDGNPYLGLVVGVALMLNTIVAVSIGGTVPLLVKRLGFDPAIASGPLLTTVTDMCGFFLVLGTATLLLDRLV